MNAHVVAVICVVGLAIGQILFKIGANSLAQTGSLFAIKTAVALGCAVALYGVTTLAWVWVLQKLDLGRVYPITALAFVLVPIASHFVFGERFHWQYFVGIALIISGILVTVR